MSRLKRLSLVLVEKAKKNKDTSYIFWENGVPKRKGNPFPIWHDLPDPLLPMSPTTAATEHPWSERRLRRAAYISHTRYTTLIEVNEQSNKLMTAKQLLWYEERAAQRARNALIANREWHRKLPSEKLKRHTRMYEALLKQYQDHLSNHKRLNTAFNILRRWIARKRAVMLLYPKPVQRTLLDFLSANRGERSMANLVRASTMHTMAMSGVQRQSLDRSYRRSNTDESRFSDLSLD